MAPRLPNILLASACLLPADAARIQRSSGPTIPVKFGDVVGSDADGCEKWMGIPFAEPPVGELRFAPPQPWQRAYPAGSWDAQAARSVCVQGDGEKGDEDCLYLNIWRPQGLAAGAKLPVMVWIHGGAFVEGSGTEELYDGCLLAKSHDVIIASMNYRLGIFGFGAFESGGGTSTNWGMQDQREALRWLQSEVGAFGGDAAKVTVFGESAGGISIWHHLVAPASRGLFRAAIVESGFPSAKELVPSLEKTEEMGRRLGCTDAASLLACMRGKTPKEIQDKDEKHNPLAPDTRLFQRWEPVEDRVELPAHPFQLLKEGKSQRVPLMHGTVNDEGTLFTYLMYPLSVRDNRYKQIVSEVWMNNPGNPTQELDADELNRVLAVYPPAGSLFSDNRPSLAEVAGDALFVCSTRFAAQMHNLHSPTWTFNFNIRSEKCPWPFPLDRVPGIFHAMEIPSVFNFTGGCEAEQEVQGVSSRMQKYWTNFAKNLDPGAAWPRYTNSGKKELHFEAADHIVDHYKENYCQEWQQLLYSKAML
jgi:para-nitrobenzyl esterase